MTNRVRLLCGVAAGAILGAVFGWVAGNTAIGIAICVAGGAIAAYVWERAEARRRPERQ
jgi:uncharacterized membrane protein